MDGPESTVEGSRLSGPPGAATAVAFELRVSLTGMDPADDLCLVLPPDYAEDSIGRLLDRAFPADRQQRSAIESMLDIRANPDLPDIYAVITNAVSGWRKGLWELSVSIDDAGGLALAEPVYPRLRHPCRDQERPGSPSCPYLHLRVGQQYQALDYAVRGGLWPSKEELLGWLRELTVLYFMDKFYYDLPVIPPDSQRPVPGVAGLQSKGLIVPSDKTEAAKTEAAKTEAAKTGADEAGTFVITGEGRAFIGRLLSETEGYIDLYDHFKDADFDDDAEDVRFDRGRGVDLRAQVYQTEGLDPIRTVFLLRLYDGSLDPFTSEWTGLIEDESFFDKILEPVVNRYDLDDALIGRVIESGYSYLEERHEQARQLSADRRIIRRVWANSPTAPIYY